jgi:hypothetical protein
MQAAKLVSFLTVHEGVNYCNGNALDFNLAGISARLQAILTEIFLMPLKSHQTDYE